MFLVVENMGKRGKMFPQQKSHLGNKKMFLNLLRNIFASRETNIVSATMFPRVGKRGNIRGNIEIQQCFLVCPRL